LSLHLGNRELQKTDAASIVTAFLKISSIIFALQGNGRNGKN
jgi:hypothetical protein